MPAPLSVIIPTLNAEDRLPKCLEALLEGLDIGLVRELIVSDGGSSDATGAVAQAWGAEVLLHETASRGGQLRRACATARGEWLLIVHADTKLQAGWADAVQAHIRSSDKAGWLSLRFDAPGFAASFVAAWANLRSRFGLPYGDQGMLISAALYAEVGGYLDQPLMEDVALARMLRGNLVGLEACAVTSAAKYRRKGWMRQGTSNLITLAQYFAGYDVERLAAKYRR